MTTIDSGQYVGDVSVHTPITAQLCGDLLVTAYESGYSWYRGYVKVEGARFIHDALLQTGRVSLKMEDPQDYENTNIYVLEFRDIVDGIQKYADMRASQGQGIIPTDDWGYDANDADCIIQYACYEDIIYG